MRAEVAVEVAVEVGAAEVEAAVPLEPLAPPTAGSASLPALA